MSESSESSYGYGESSYSPPPRKSTPSLNYNPPICALPSPTKDKVESDYNLESLNNIKKSLKEIEEFITHNLTPAEKDDFIKVFRDIVMNNEDEVLNFPTPSFFIAKFEPMDKSAINENLKIKVIGLFHEKEYSDKQKKSKLKYW